MKNYINTYVEKLIKKYKTNNPFDIAKFENIIILKEHLGSIYGYYNQFARQKFIHINSDLSDELQTIICAHELGHAKLHPKFNTQFFRTNTFYSIDKFEREANLFASELLIRYDSIDKLITSEYSLYEIAAYYKLPVELLQLKFNLVL